MLRICDHPHCTTLTIGMYCVRHEEPVLEQPFPRGRPFPAAPDRLIESRPVLVAPMGAYAGERMAGAGAVSLEGGS
jgi:hypothetical protein